MQLQTLEQAGLSAEQAMIYDTLLTKGEVKAGQLLNLLPYKRGLTYKVLDQLIEMGLVEKIDEIGKVSRFKPNHPLKIKDFIEKRIREVKDAELAVNTAMPTLITNFNSISQAPGISYYPGIEGVEKVIFETLNAQSEVLQYADIEAIIKNIPEIQEKFSAKRDLIGQKKKAIITGSEFNKKFVSENSTRLIDTKYLAFNMEGFGSTMYIYDDYIAYVILSQENKMGIVINNPQLAKMHKQLFKFNWEMGKNII